MLDRRHAEADQPPKGASEGTRGDEESDAFGEILLGVPEGEVERHGLSEHRLAETDEETADKEAGAVESGGLTRRGDGPDDRARRDRVRRVDRFGKEGARDLSDTLVSG